MKLWLDDLRPAPEGWTWAKTVVEAKLWIIWAFEFYSEGFEECSLDHDLGQGPEGEGIKLIDWMAEFHFWPAKKPVVHSMNPVSKARMEATINRYFPRYRDEWEDDQWFMEWWM